MVRYIVVQIIPFVMKKTAGWILKIAGGLVVFLLVLMFTLPVLFKDRISASVVKVINESVNARVSFDGYSLSFFRQFPNLSFGLDGITVAGVDKFGEDTLARLGSFDLVFNLASIFKKSGYEIKSIMLDRLMINAIVLEDGTANWDIAKDTSDTEEADETESALSLKLHKLGILNSSVSYNDLSSGISALLQELNLDLAGNMDKSETELDIDLNIGELSMTMDDIKYLNKAVLDASIGLAANLDSMKFVFNENHVAVNDLIINFTGMLAMPGDDIETDIDFSTETTSFKTLLSLVPAVYMKDYEDLSTSGDFILNGSAKGIYSDADSTLPDINIRLKVNDGLISYPDLPEKIRDINIDMNAFIDGKDMDRTRAAIDLFHFELAGNPFDLKFALQTPLSDPDFSASMNGKIDLSALTSAVPLDSISLSGIINMSVNMAGRLSEIEREEYDKFRASGNLDIKNMLVAMTGYPEVKINDAGFEFSPAFAALTSSSLRVGEKSDFAISGRLENYIPYLLKDETIKGNLALRSDFVDVSEILSKISTDTTVVEDTTSLALIRIPENIDFDFNAAIGRFTYDMIQAQNVQGHIIVRDGVLSFRETGLDMLGGKISLDADYDTRDTLKPVMKAALVMKNIGIVDAFTSFNTIQKLAPAAENVDGRINLSLSYESLLGSGMMPVISTITGGGLLQSDEITLVKSAAYDKMKELLKLGEKYTNTFKDLNISFRMSDGRVYVSPFDTKAGNIKMNISGDQGLDQTMNYLIKTEFPRSELGSSVNALMDNLSSMASSFGVALKPSETVKINVRLTGLFGKPVVTPVFGDGSNDGQASGTAAETVKQAAGAAVDQGREKLIKEAEEQGDRLIAEAESKARLIREEAAAGADKIRQEADLQADKLVEEASTKGTVAKLAAERAALRIKQEADKKATQLTTEADNRAGQLVEEAKTKKQELIDRI